MPSASAWLFFFFFFFFFSNMKSQILKLNYLYLLHLPQVGSAVICFFLIFFSRIENLVTLLYFTLNEAGISKY